MERLGDNLKRLTSILILFLFVFSVCSASGALVRMDVIKYEPYPIEPGRYVHVWVRVVNEGNSETSYDSIEFEPVYPFSLDNNEVNSKVVGTLAPGRELIFEYKIRVDENAVSGDNEMRFSLISNTGSKITKLFNVIVQPHKPIINVKRVSTNPETLVPGKESLLVIELENMADSFLKDISVRVDLSSETVPFVPIGSTSEKRIYTLNSKQVTTVSFDIMALPNAKSGVYKIPLIISYSDGLGNDYTMEESISLIVNDLPNLFVYVERSDIISSNQAGSVRVGLVNKGFTDLKFMKVELLNSDDFEKIGKDIIYIGDLDSDYEETIDFKIYIPQSGKDSISLPLRLTYADKINNEYSDDVIVTLRLYSSSEVSRYNLNGKGKNNWIVGLILVGLVGYFVYKKYWKKK